MDSDNGAKPHEAQFMFYKGPDGTVHARVIHADNTVWLSQQKMAELFGVDAPTISYHLHEAFQAGELAPGQVARKVQITAANGNVYQVDCYNLDAIISVSYRVHSNQAGKFREYATRTLHDYMVKGYVLDDYRIAQGERLNAAQYNELLERTNDLRASERWSHQRLTDMFTTARDYNQDPEVTRDFYRTVQNKLHYAIHGYTAPELIVRRADATLPHMGLTNWKQYPNDRIRKSDVNIAKNYLTQSELKDLNRLVTMYLLYAEDQIERRFTPTMDEWSNRLDAFLRFNEYEILDHPSRVTPEAAKSIAEQEYEKFQTLQRAA